MLVILHASTFSIVAWQFKQACAAFKMWPALPEPATYAHCVDE